MLYNVIEIMRGESPKNIFPFDVPPDLAVFICCHLTDKGVPPHFLCGHSGVKEMTMLTVFPKG